MKTLKSRFIRLAPSSRLYEFDRPVIALTGGIATGKSTVTKLLEAKGLKVIDADQLVKRIYATSLAQEFIKNNYPEAWDGKINFKILREIVFQNPETKRNIESFIYGHLPEAFAKAAAEVKNQNFYIYDVPLLFERGLEKSVDLTVVVYAPRKIQLARLLDRDGNKEELGNKILNHQMDIEDKKIKADFVIDNSRGLAELTVEVDSFLREILESDHRN